MGRFDVNQIALYSFSLCDHVRTWSGKPEWGSPAFTGKGNCVQDGDFPPHQLPMQGQAVHGNSRASTTGYHHQLCPWQKSWKGLLFPVLFQSSSSQQQSMLCAACVSSASASPWLPVSQTSLRDRAAQRDSAAQWLGQPEVLQCL